MIEVEGVTKAYRIYRRKADWLKERFLRRPLHETKLAVRDISFAVGQGEVLGIIGRNGAGKSTVLKLIMGVAMPDTGTVRVSGRVTGMLELGTGFNSDLTGRENIAFNATLLGMTPEEIAAKREAIIAFSELGTAIDDPIHTYSSGMVVRLAFAIAIHADPACFVVDEALSVGDVHFQQKCMRRIKEFKANGGSIVFVSHDLNAVKVLCDRAIVLEEGEVVANGDPEFAVNRYNRIIARMEGADIDLATPALEAPEPDADAPEAAPSAPSAPSARADNGADNMPESGNGGDPAPPPGPDPRTRGRSSYGTGEVEIVSGRVLGEESGGAVLAAGETAVIEIRARARQAIAGATLGILIRDRFGQDIFGTNTYYLGQTVDLEAGCEAVFRFRQPMNIGPGVYSLTAALHRDEHHLETCYHWVDNLAALEVAGYAGPRFQGLCRLEPTFTMTARQTVDV